MKRILMLLTALFLGILLAGCISIPLGDGGKLEVSKDGLNVDLGEEDGTESAEQVADETAEESMDGVEEETTETETGIESNSDDEAVEEEAAPGMQESGNCGAFIENPEANNDAIERFMKTMEPDYPLPDCVYMGTVTENPYGDNADQVRAPYQVEGSWKTVFEMYENYLNSEFGEREVEASPDFNNLSGRLYLKNDEYYYDIKISESEGITSIDLDFLRYFEVEE